MAMAAAASPALAETHPFLFSFGSFSIPNGMISSTACAAIIMVMTVATPAFAETHPLVSSFGSFSNPNGIAIDESTGDVYVADLGTNTVSKFDASGGLVESWGTKGQIDGSTTSAGSFSFPNEPGSPAAIAVDNSTSPTDPSVGDLYVMDAGHEVIDKFNAKGEYVSNITGPFEGELLGLGVDGSGNVRVDVKNGSTPQTDVFDNALANDRVASVSGAQSFAFEEEERLGTQAHGFATASQPGSDYRLFSPCGCIAKIAAEQGEYLGRVDTGSTGVAAAVDPVTGHVYIDEQLSVTEWDTGQLNGGAGDGITPLGTLISTFGSLQLTSPSPQGGIAVNGASGNVYVSNPADGKVYVFATTVPAAAAAAASSVSRTEATLHGTVDPRGAPLTSCQFEYGTSASLELEIPLVHLDHSVSCEQTPAHIGSGTAPVPVSAHVEGLLPGTLYRFRLVAGNENGAAPSAGLFPTAASAGFGIKNFEVAFLNRDGTPDTQAGSHPYEVVTNIDFDTQVVQRRSFDHRYIARPFGNVKDVTVHLPPGFYGDPNATAKKCTLEELSAGGLEDHCPAESEIGEIGSIVRTEIEGGITGPPNLFSAPLLSIVPPLGVTFQMAGHIKIPNAFINVGLPAGGDSGLTATSFGIPSTAPIFSTRLTVFGVPPHGATKPLLTMPTACNGPLTSTISADSYQEAGHFATATSVTRNSAGSPGGMTSCAPLTFPPSLDAKPDVSNASSSSGLNVGVHVSQKAALNPTGLAESSLRDTTVTLPPGVAVNPAGANGLEACSEGLAGFTGFAEFNPSFEPGDRTATFSSTLLNELQPGVSFCPDGSKIGTAKLKTPLLEHELEGAVYLAAPAPNGEEGQNPFNSLITMYMVIEDPVSGTLVKVPFKVQLCEAAGQVISGMTCQATGQIITTAHNTPQLPFEDLQLHFFGGERAPLTTPSHCGTYTTLATFAPWSGNAPVNTSASFRVESRRPNGQCPGAGCRFRRRWRRFVELSSGRVQPVHDDDVARRRRTEPAGCRPAHAPRPVRAAHGREAVPRSAGQRGHLRPGKPDRGNDGQRGLGGNPFTVKGGKVYITGPYKGAPFGLSIVNPADAGPFDLGKVIVAREDRSRPDHRGADDHDRQRRPVQDPDDPRGHPAADQARERHDQPPRLHVQPHQLQQDADRRQPVEHRRSHPNPRGALPGHQLRDVEVRPEILGLHIRENLESERREPDRQADLSQGAVRVPGEHREGQGRPAQSSSRHG